GARSPVVIVLALVAAALAACGNTVTPLPTALRASASSDTVPLGTTFATTTGVVAVVAMGRRSDPQNTFWQLFVRPHASATWTLATPPGVADNGGLGVDP